MNVACRVRRWLGTEERGPFECGNCHSRFERNRQACPRCRSYRIERSTYEDLIAD